MLHPFDLNCEVVGNGKLAWSVLGDGDVCHNSLETLSANCAQTLGLVVMDRSLKKLLLFSMFLESRI